MRACFVGHRNGGLSPGCDDAGTFAPAPGSAYAYRMTQPLVALRYFRTFFIPNRLSADSDLALVKSMLDREPGPVSSSSLC